jgi:hypothetical protein
MYFSATTTAVPPAANLAAAGMVSNRWQGQWPAARQDERRRKSAPTLRRPKRGPRSTRNTRSPQGRTRRTIARLKQRFVLAPWMAAGRS